MKFQVVLKRKVQKNLVQMPVAIQHKFWFLVERLQDQGPVQPRLPNYSKLGKNEYHCHLGYSWCACWKHERIKQ